MKKIFQLILLLSLCLPGCRKKNNVVVKSKPLIQNVDRRETGKILSEDADEFSLEDDAGFNVFEDENKKQVESKEQSEEELKWEEVDENDSKEFETIQFDYDQTALKPLEKAKVKKNSKLLKEKLNKNKDAQVRVKGHSCKIAKNKEHNYVVSQERASELKKEYIANGIPEDRIKAVGYGDSMLISDEDGMEAQSPNRRAETVIG